MRLSERTVFQSESEAVAVWCSEYRRMSQKAEHAAMVYSTFRDGKKVYYTGRTYRGTGGFGFIRPNVVLPFVFMYLFQSVIQRLLHKARMESFVHTHPMPGKGFTYRYHSKEDMFLLRLPGIHAVYVVPYENDEISRQPAAGDARRKC